MTGPVTAPRLIAAVLLLYPVFFIWVVTVKTPTDRRQLWHAIGAAGIFNFTAMCISLAVWLVV